MAALGAALSVRAADIDFEGLPDTGLDTSAWTTGENPPIDDMVDANDFQFAAKNKLNGRRYAYYRTAALDEITYERNMHDWEKLRMNGFAFNDVSNLYKNTSILGYEFATPFFVLMKVALPRIPRMSDSPISFMVLSSSVLKMSMSLAMPSWP